MEPEIQQLIIAETQKLWEFTMWGFGLCAAGFFTTIGLVVSTTQRMVKPIKEIRDALIGTYEKKGLITKFHDLEKKVEGMEDAEG